MANIAFFLEWDWAAGEVLYRRAQELDPNYSWGQQFFAEALASQGRFDEALEQLERMHERSPIQLTPLGDVDLGLVLYRKGDVEAAVAAWQWALDLSPSHYTSLINLGRYLCDIGRIDEALELLARARLNYPNTPRILAEQAACNAASGRVDEARQLLEELQAWTLQEYVDPVNLAIVYLELGEYDRMFEWLELGYQRHAVLMTRLGSDPRFVRLYGNPRFDDLLVRIGLREPSPKG